MLNIPWSIHFLSLLRHCGRGSECIEWRLFVADNYSSPTRAVKNRGSLAPRRLSNSRNLFLFSHKPELVQKEPVWIRPNRTYAAVRKICSSI